MLLLKKYCFLPWPIAELRDICRHFVSLLFTLAEDTGLSLSLIFPPESPWIPGTSKPPRADHPADERNYPLERSYIQECLLGTTLPSQAIKSSLLLIILIICVEGGWCTRVHVSAEVGGIRSGAGASTKLRSSTRAVHTLLQNQ